MECGQNTFLEADVVPISTRDFLALRFPQFPSLIFYIPRRKSRSAPGDARARTGAGIAERGDESNDSRQRNSR
eukprot:6083944-Pleurochrysis_carterae.AAC.1